MRATATLFERILAKAHHQISGDGLGSYNTDFSGLLIPRDPELKALFREIAESMAALVAKQRINVFVMFYDDVAFCIRFHPTIPLGKINVRMTAEALEELPRSSGRPHFIIGSNEPTRGMSWVEVATDDEEKKAEIFPLIDFEGVCFYYARARASPTTFTWTTSSAVDSAVQSQTSTATADSSGISNPLAQKPMSYQGESYLSAFDSAVQSQTSTATDESSSISNPLAQKPVSYQGESYLSAFDSAVQSQTSTATDESSSISNPLAQKPMSYQGESYLSGFDSAVQSQTSTATDDSSSISNPLTQKHSFRGQSETD